MRNFFAVLTAAALLAGTASQADSITAPASLSPGHPAGLKKAQDDTDNTLWYVVGAGAIAAGIVLVATSGNSNNNNGSTGTSSSSTQ